MNEKHALFVWISYALFGAMILWDYLAPRLRERRALKNVLRRQQRDAARRGA